MKISNSKKELARIISLNGGWRDGAEFSALEESAGDVWFCKERPKYKIGLGIFSFNDFMGAIDGGFEFARWHQTILSRAEYLHLYPAPDADGWIEYDGKGSPYSNDVVVEAKWTDGDFTCSDNFGPGPAWIVDGNAPNITHHRLHKPEQSEQSEPEFCESVMRSIPEPETKPTIEQLAAEHEEYLDRAKRLQEGANIAKADADAKLAELVAAGKALGLVLSVATPDPELVITDWRDLRVGDVIQCVGDAWENDFEGNEAVVNGIESHDYKYEHRILAAIGEESDWGADFKFIRRP